MFLILVFRDLYFFQRSCLKWPRIKDWKIIILIGYQLISMWSLEMVNMWFYLDKKPCDWHVSKLIDRPETHSVKKHWVNECDIDQVSTKLFQEVLRKENKTITPLSCDVEQWVCRSVPPWLCPVTGGWSGLEPCQAQSAGRGYWSWRCAAAPPPACAGRPAPEPETAAPPSAPRSEPVLCRGPRPASGSSSSAPHSPPPGLGFYPPSGELWRTEGPSSACAALPPAVLRYRLDLKSIKVV